MDDLENMGVVAKPEDVDVTVEYVSPSFLIKKEDDYRLVTAFNMIGTYAKPSPSRSTSSEDVLRFLARFPYIIKTDMTKQFFQLPMKKSSMKYLGVLTPYKGMRVYTRAAMGMPGSTEQLDELMSRVLGDMLTEGSVVKIADDLYLGGNSVEELLASWEKLLSKFAQNDLRLSASKTVICPTNTTILGWVWASGTITASSHKTSPLATACRPKTVKGLRSWIGAFKHLKCCIPMYTDYIHQLESITSGKESQECIHWTPDLTTTFHKAQNVLKDVKTITIPRPSDHLIVTNDGAVIPNGIGSILYVLRGKQMLLGGFFSAKLKPHQIKWLPCEVEALAIGAAVKHWAPYILESINPVQILTDSRPCIQAYNKLSTGQFSSSARVSTFLSTLSRYKVALQHIAGSSNLPADYHSRNPMECQEAECQVCKFVHDSTDITVNNLTISDIVEGKLPMPFISRPAWKSTQQDCPSLRRTYAHLSQGTRPNRKANNIRDVKRYLRVSTLSRDGIIIVKEDIPFAPSRSLIVVPRHVLSGLLTALHLKLNHPTKSQLSKVFHRSFYALDADRDIAYVTEQCAMCASIATLPKEVEEFSTCDPILKPGIAFACDILCRARQKIYVLRDCFSTFTVTKIIQNEQKESLRDAIIETTAELMSPSGCTIRIDGGSALVSLTADAHLKRRNIVLEQGRTKNRNKNPVAEKAIQELEKELKRAHPEGGPVNQCNLAIVTATLNSRIHNRGLSAREIISQRDSMTGEQLNFSDSILAEQQHITRERNHIPSAISQATQKTPAVKAHITVGDLIFLKNDGDKHTARDKYIVTQLEDNKVFAKKLVGFQFRSRVYELKLSEVYKVPSAPSPDISLHNPMVKSNPYCSDPSDDNQSDIDDAEDHVNPSTPKPFQVPKVRYQIPLREPLPPEIVLDDPPLEVLNAESPNVLSVLPPTNRDIVNDILSDSADDSPGHRRSTRTSKRPSWLDDYVPK